MEACQRNVNMEETVLQLCAALLVTSIHCTTASVMLIAYYNVKMYSEKFIMENY